MKIATADNRETTLADPYTCKVSTFCNRCVQPSTGALRFHNFTQHQ
jgi:hypothetical protein